MLFRSIGVQLPSFVGCNLGPPLATVRMYTEESLGSLWTFTLNLSSSSVCSLGAADWAVALPSDFARTSYRFGVQPARTTLNFHEARTEACADQHVPIRQPNQCPERHAW